MAKMPHFRNYCVKIPGDLTRLIRPEEKEIPPLLAIPKRNFGLRV